MSETKNNDNISDIKPKKNTIVLATIIADKNGDYYYDDNGGIWNDKFEWIGSYNNNENLNKNYFFDNIKKIKNKITRK
jgi:hypothetical protein